MKNIYKQISGYLILLIFPSLLFGFIFFSSVLYGFWGHIYTKEEIKSFRNDCSSIILSADHKQIGSIYSKNRIEIKYEDIPAELVNCLIAVEDSRFYEHKGVDVRGYARSSWGLISGKNKGGGSTLSQQLAKNMYGREKHRFLSMAVNKTKEAIIAHRLESVLSKEEIIEKYLNTVPFGDNIYGIEAAAQHYYQLNASQLGVDQAAVLIGLLKANTIYHPYHNPENAIKRRNTVLKLMQNQQYITAHEYDSLQKLPLNLKYKVNRKADQNQYLVQLIQKEAESILATAGTELNLETDGLIIETSILSDLQQSACSAINSQLWTKQKQLDQRYAKSTFKREAKKYKLNPNALDSFKREYTKLHAGLLALHPQSGAILAYVGGLDYVKYPYDQVKAKRQMASLFKPFLYANALQHNLTPCSLLDNSPVVFEDYENWNPENSTHNYGGRYSMTAALSNSMNVPAVRMYLESNKDSLNDLWASFQFKNSLTGKPSVALGTADASLWEVTRAYSAFANQGVICEPYTITAIRTSGGEVIYSRNAKTKRTRACSKQTCLAMNYMLNKALKEGTGQNFKDVYGLDLEMAAKTGTSQSYKDAWFVCYNSSIVIATRVGANSPNIHFNSGQLGSASALALPIVAKTIKYHMRANRKGLPYYSGLPMIDEVDCPEYKADGPAQILARMIHGIETTTEKEQKRIKRARKREDFFAKLKF